MDPDFVIELNARLLAEGDHQRNKAKRAKQGKGWSE